MFSKIDCFFVGLWETLRHWFRRNKETVSGHTFVDAQVYRNCAVIVTNCEDCGKIDITWVYEGKQTDQYLLETYKVTNSDPERL